MQIFVVGATGRVGTMLTEVLAKKGYQVCAALRDKKRMPVRLNVSPVEFDLHDSVADMAEAMNGSDVVYFAAGSRGNDLLQSDLYGAVKVMQAAERAGIKRFIHLSSMFALEPEYWHEPAFEPLLDYTIAKFFSDHWLIHNTGLAYTILQPGALTEAEGTGKIETAVTRPQSNTVEDVAATLAAVLDYPNTIGKVIKMHNGNVPIEEALQQL